jgi:hypothetical protein
MSNFNPTATPSAPYATQIQHAPNKMQTMAPFLSALAQGYQAYQNGQNPGGGATPGQPPANPSSLPAGQGNPSTPATNGTIMATPPVQGAAGGPLGDGGMGQGMSAAANPWAALTSSLGAATSPMQQALAAAPTNAPTGSSGAPKTIPTTVTGGGVQQVQAPQNNSMGSLGALASIAKLFGA